MNGYLRHIFTIMVSLASMAAAAADIYVRPGTLSDLLETAGKEDKVLTLTGSMDLRDFHALVSGMPQLEMLNLFGVSVTAFEFANPVSYGPQRNAANELPAGALLGLKLKELVLPSNLTAIGDGALSGNQFETLILPSTLTFIGDNALYGCDKLVELTLPAGVSNLGGYALAGCTTLQSLDMSATAVSRPGVRAFAGDTALRSISLPDGLTDISEGCFSNTPMLQSVSLPSSLTEISTNAFTMSGLERVTIPASVSVIGDFAFSQCPHLVSATLENPEAKLGRGIFFADPEFVVFNAPGIKVFPDYLFAETGNFEPATLAPELNEIGAYSLKDNRAESLTFGSELVYLGTGVMENMTGLKDINVADMKGSVPAMGENVFSGIKQEEVNLTVDKDSEDIWRNAPQWNEFKIVSLIQVGGVDVTADAEDVKCHFDGTVLKVESLKNIDLLEMYSPAGKKILEQTPDSMYAYVETGHLSERVYIVRAYLSNGATATFKLMR